MFIRCAARISFREVFFSGAVWKKRALSIRFSRRDILRALFAHSHPVSRPSRFPLFVFISLVRQWFAAIKPHRQATHVYRVPKDTLLLFPSTGPLSSARLIGGAYDIFVIMLPDTCPSVTTALVTNSREPFFHFTAMYIHVLFPIKHLAEKGLEFFCNNTHIEYYRFFLVFLLLWK
jgi:hypothetical protein